MKREIKLFEQMKSEIFIASRTLLQQILKEVL